MGKKKGLKKPKSVSNRAGHAQVQDESGNIYVIGGYNDSGMLADMWKYDVTGTWALCPIKNPQCSPLPRVDFAACMLVNEKMKIS